MGLESIPHDLDDRVNVSPGYSSNVVVRWGDVVLPGAPEFSLSGQTAEAAAKQFGFNCDYNGFFPLLPGQSKRGLLAVNHEYTSGVDMFPGYDAENVTAEQVAIEIASHGMLLTGPGAGSIYTITNADPTGVDVLGMLNNCSGG